MSPFAKFFVAQGDRPSMERIVRPFVPIRALALDRAPAIAATAIDPGVFSWGDPSNFDQVNAFEALAASPRTRRASGPPERGVDAEDVEYEFSNSIENFTDDGKIRRVNVQGPDLAEDRRIMAKTPFGHSPDHASRMTWIFDYSPLDS
jgi:hypothetical protein